MTFDGRGLRFLTSSSAERASPGSRSGGRRRFLAPIMALLAVTAGFGAPAFAAPSPNFLYVVNIDQTNPFTNTAISQFNIDTGGTLTALSPASVNVGGAPGGLYADPKGRFLYLAQPGPVAVLQFTINNNGTLSSATAATSNNPDAPFAVVIDPSDQYAYVENESIQSIFQYSVGANGAFTALNPPRLVNGSAVPLALHPSGQYAYASNALYGIYQYAIGTGGTLTPLNPPSVPAGSLPGCIAMHPSGNFAYVVNVDGNTISQFAVNAGGTLSALSPATVPFGNPPPGNWPGCLAVHPNGNFLYLASWNGDAIYQFGIAANGILTPLSPASLPTGLFPVSIYLDPTGSYAYVPSPRAGTISQYSVAANGTLAPLSPATVASPGAGWIAIATVFQFVAPTCADNAGGTVQLGCKQYLPCPSGQVGTSACPSVSRACPPVSSPVIGAGLPNCGTQTCLAQNSWSTPPDFSMCDVACTDKGSTFPVGATETESCAGGQSGTQTRTCNTGGNWGPWNTSACACPAGQLLCFNDLTQAKQCFTPLGGIFDNSGVFHSWCGHFDSSQEMDCSIACAAGVACAPAHDNVNHVRTTDVYCGDGNISPKTGGGSNVALVTFVALMAAWSIAGIWRRRKMASR